MQKHKSREEINANIFKVLYGMLNKCKRTPLYIVRTRERIFIPVSGFLPLKFLLLCNAFPSQILRPLISPASSTVVQFSLSFPEYVCITSGTGPLAFLWQHPPPEVCSNRFSSILNQTLSWSCSQSLKAAPVYRSTHISRMLVKHVTFVNTGYASTPSLTPIPMGLTACQDDQFLLTLFKKVNPLLRLEFQIMKCILLWAAHRRDL